jgi:hypothetical protein
MSPKSSAPAQHAAQDKAISRYSGIPDTTSRQEVKGGEPENDDVQNTLGSKACVDGDATFVGCLQKQCMR